MPRQRRPRRKREEIDREEAERERTDPGSPLKKSKALKHWNELHYNGPRLVKPWQPLKEEHWLKYSGKPLQVPGKVEEIVVLWAKRLEKETEPAAAVAESFYSHLEDLINYYTRTYVHRQSLDFTGPRNFVKALSATGSSITNKLANIEDGQAAGLHATCIKDGECIDVQGFQIGPATIASNGVPTPRITTEEITLNISEDWHDSPYVSSHTWQQVISNPKVAWVAKWKYRGSNRFNYVNLAPHSSITNDQKLDSFWNRIKELMKYRSKIFDEYQAMLASDDSKQREMGLIIWMLDRCLIRIGRDDNRPHDNIGILDLTQDHVKVLGNQVRFDFVGGGGVKYNKQFADEKAATALGQVLRDTLPGNKIFGNVIYHDVHDSLDNIVRGLTSKDFRTLAANAYLEEALSKDMPPQQQPKDYFNQVCLDLAEHLNYQSGGQPHMGSVISSSMDPRLAVKFARQHGIDPNNLTGNLLPQPKLKWALQQLGDADIGEGGSRSGGTQERNNDTDNIE